MVNREKFYDLIRHEPFPGHIVTPQVEGMEVILNAQEYFGHIDLRWCAYEFATTYHETAATMQPIEEFGKGKNHPYGEPVNGHAYYGRGFVQLTWDYNYKKLGEILKIDLLNHPELALDPATAASIMCIGMEEGIFTGKRLSTYFHEETSDWINARKIINRLDRANLIAGYAKEFYSALTKAT